MNIPKNIIFALLVAIAGLALQARVIAPLLNNALRSLLINYIGLANMLQIVINAFLGGLWFFLSLYVLQEFRKYK